MPNPFTSFFDRIREAVRHRTVVFLTQTEKTMGISPDVSFKTMTEIYLGDLATRASIDFLSDQIAGQGFYTTMNEEYQEKSEGKTAKEIVDEFCDAVGLDEVLQASAKYLVGWGNVFWWVGSPVKIEFLQPLPLEIIKDDGVKFDAKGNITQVVFDWKRDPAQVSGDELIHLAYNVLTAKPLGVGILQSLATPLDIGEGEQREPFYMIKGTIHASMAGQLEKFGAPNEIWSFPGLNETKTREADALIKNMSTKGNRFVINPPEKSNVTVQPVVAERMRGLDFYVETLEDEFILGLQTPLAKLVTRTGFTEASANAALEIAERRVGALQRFLKRGVERYIFDRVVAQAGLDPAKAQVRLTWGMPESLDYEKLNQILGQLTELLKVDPTVITHDELRKVLRDVAKLPLEEQEEIPSQVPEVIKQVVARRSEAAGEAAHS